MFMGERSCRLFAAMSLAWFSESLLCFFSNYEKLIFPSTIGRTRRIDEGSGAGWIQNAPHCKGWVPMNKRVMTWMLAMAGAAWSPQTFAQETDVSVTIPGVVEATADSQSYLNGLYLKQWIRTEASRFSGRIIELSSLESGSRGVAGHRVTLIREGQLFAETLSDEQGNYHFTGVPSGLYTLAAVSGKSVGVIALNVLEGEAGAHLGSQVDLPVSQEVPGSARRLLAGQFRPNMSTGFSYASQDPIAPQRDFASSFSVIRDAEGRVEGNVRSATNPSSRDYSDTQVLITRDGQEVFQTRASASGSFRLEGMQPGVYGIVAAGSHGIYSSSFVVSDDQQSISQTLEGERFVAKISSGCPALNCELGCHNDYTVVETLIEDCTSLACQDPCGCPMPMGGFGGGYAGGGGGGGGGGFGGGGLGAIAIAGGIIAIIATDETDPPVSQ